jgi:hypothetical protein
MSPQHWLQGRLEDLAAQLLEAEDKVADLQRLADQSRSLKDEVDILRETSDKVRMVFGLPIPDPDPISQVRYPGSGSYLSSIPDPDSSFQVFRIRIILVKYSEFKSYCTCQVFRIRILLVKYSGSGFFL